MKRIEQSYGFSSRFTSEFPGQIPQSYDPLQQSSPVELFNQPSSTTDNRSQPQEIESTALYATEGYYHMGLSSQYDFQENITNSCSFNNSNQIIPLSYQEFGTSFVVDSLPEVPEPGSSYGNPLLPFDPNQDLCVSVSTTVEWPSISKIY